MSDVSVDNHQGSAPSFMEVLRDLRRLAATGFTNNDQDLIILDSLEEVIPVREDGKRFSVMFDPFPVSSVFEFAHLFLSHAGRLVLIALAFQ